MTKNFKGCSLGRRKIIYVEEDNVGKYERIFLKLKENK